MLAIGSWNRCMHSPMFTFEEKLTTILADKLHCFQGTQYPQESNGIIIITDYYLTANVQYFSSVCLWYE